MSETFARECRPHIGKNRGTSAPLGYSGGNGVHSLTLTLTRQYNYRIKGLRQI